MAVGYVQVAVPGPSADAAMIESRAHGWLYRRPAANPAGVRALESGIARADMLVDGRLIPEGGWFAKLAYDDSGELAKGAFVFQGVDLDGRPFAVDVADAPTPVAKTAVAPFERACLIAETGAVLKADDERRLVGGIVLQPDIADSQGDVVSAAEIEKAAHRFMVQRTPLGVQHGPLAPESVRPVESYLAPADFVIDTPRGPELVRKGSWIVTAHVPDERLWAQVKNGGFTGWSIAGTGRRSPITKTAPPAAAAAPDRAELAAAIALVFESMRTLFAKEDAPVPPPQPIHVHVPPPVIENHVHIPAQEVPQVTVNVPQAAPPVVQIEMPKPRAVKAKRDAHGNTTYTPVDP